jgi:hypothetical protein
MLLRRVFKGILDGGLVDGLNMLRVSQLNPRKFLVV